ncbi:hypothetical protein QWZ16_24490 [Vibrio ostreicida]|uniref:Uncharacterized protein n=1 Tax=Vibrio ostreicida TaxID=526588 RepID=A0ABT8C2Z6_9VIBR|nr:hypothetical protein [Vibrio ostreicida]MDN3612727.1 hypothetical protein [Vibrio ostreicida]
MEKLNQSLEDTITKRTLDLQTSLAELKTPKKDWSNLKNSVP